MTIETVLFDFSGTLFDPARVVDGPAFAACAKRRGRELAESRAHTLGHRILEYGESPAGLRERVRCDLSAAEHRAGWVATAVLVPGVDPVLAEAFHDCITDPARWRPYQDTGPVLRALRDDGVRVGVVSNCGWDLRGSFERAGLADLVDAYALSFEHGCAKPGPELFRVALDALAADPARTVMVGDDARTDSGALSVGIAVRLLPAAPSHPAPRGLGRVLSAATLLRE
ncbi:HAD family hydrolase [Micromonospora sp. NPDC049102]|uniref:HAD family hydrolase n=1 Tax=Micromonospora sp. NPDC049102 TaxID=3364265 RepID=UPI0037143A49